MKSNFTNVGLVDCQAAHTVEGSKSILFDRGRPGWLMQECTLNEAVILLLMSKLTASAREQSRR